MIRHWLSGAQLVHCIIYWLTPFVFDFLTGDLHRQMREPVVWSCAMPMLNTRRNVDNVAGMQLPDGLSSLLIVAPPGGAEQNLTAAGLHVVDVPVVPASRFKGDMEDSDLICGERRQIALPSEVLGEPVVGGPDGEDCAKSVWVEGEPSAAAMTALTSSHIPACRKDQFSAVPPPSISVSMPNSSFSFLIARYSPACPHQRGHRKCPAGAESLCRRWRLCRSAPRSHGP